MSRAVAWLVLPAGAMSPHGEWLREDRKVPALWRGIYGKGGRQEEIRVAIDGPSGAAEDNSEQREGPGPEKGHEYSRSNARRADAQPAEARIRAEYYQALRSVEIRVAAADRAESTAGTAWTRLAWDSGAVGDHPDPPLLESLHVVPERAKHILDGDRWGGGHRHGTGRPGKTEFPSGWEDDKIIGHILDVACAPNDPPVFQANRRWRVHGQRDDVGITVIVQPDGRIWSAWPDAGSPGVVKNPRETP